MRSPEDRTIEKKSTRSKSTWMATGALAAGLLLVGCGGSDAVDALNDLADDSSQSEDGSETGSATGSEEFAGDGASVLEIELGNPTTFTMPEGQSVADANFEVPAGGVVTVTVQAPDSNRGDLFLQVRTPESQGSMMTAIPGAEPEEQRFVTAAESGTRWGLSVQSAAGETIRITINAVAQDDAGVGTDAAGDASNPTPIAPGATVTGLLEGSDFSDWYQLPLAGGDIVSINLDMIDDTGTGGVGASLQFNGQPIASTSVFPGGEEAVTYIFAADQAGDSYVEITGTGVYSFEIMITSQDDGGSGGDAGADQGSATAAAFGTISGVLGDGDSYDVYELALPTDAVIFMEASEPVGDMGGLGIQLSHDGGDIATLDLSPGATESIWAIVVNDTGEIAYLTVSGQGTYDIVISAATQSDGGDGSGDAGGEAASAKEIAADASIEGWLGGDDQRDYYTFTPTTTGLIDIAISLDPDFEGYTTVSTRAGGPAISTISVDRGGTGNETIEVEAGQEYTIEVQSPYELH